MERIDYRKESIPFTQVANSVLSDPNLSAKAKGLYAYLYSKPDDWDFSLHRIVLEMADGKRAIASGLRELEEAGYLTRTREASGRMTYTLRLKSLVAKTATRQNRNMLKPQHAKTATVSNTDIKVILSNSNTDNPYSGLDEEPADLFSEFWKAYPKKVAKTVAEKAFKKQKIDRTKLDEILSFIEKAKKTESWTKQKGQFVPHPSTFLNGKRWEDDLASYGQAKPNTILTSPQGKYDNLTKTTV